MTIDQLYKNYYHILVGYAKSKLTRGNYQNAIDLVHDSFEHLIKWLKEDNQRILIEGKEITFILTIMHRIAIDNYKSFNSPKNYRIELPITDIGIRSIGYYDNSNIDYSAIIKELTNIDRKATQYFLLNNSGYQYDELTTWFKKTESAMKTKVCRLKKEALKSKVLNSMIAIITILTMTISCNCPEKECTYDGYTVSQIDSIYNAKQSKIDSLYNAAMNEVTVYRTASIKQVDSLRTSYLTWQTLQITELNDWADSFKTATIYNNPVISTHHDSSRNINMYDNMIIQGDHEAEIYFDETTGKPVLKIK